MKKIWFSVLLVAFLLGCKKTSVEGVAGKIAGQISVSAELAAQVKDSDVLYVIARSEQSGPPLAVKRFEAVKLPLNYVIGQEDKMIPGNGGFEAGTNITIAARLSKSGNAIGAPGDLEGVYKNNPAKPGLGGVDVVIDRVRE